jgi:hypothetical protein
MNYPFNTSPAPAFINALIGLIHDLIATLDSRLLYDTGQRAYSGTMNAQLAMIKAITPAQS